ncbi:MAG: hypothetical protein DRI30_05075 [Chloroflexi bacterium]|nr:MAG: hypothetical protein DRI30_05075 [Chloroflexota bacterium]
MSTRTINETVRETALGLQATKTLASAATADMFTVTGEVWVTLMYGIVTGVGDGGATTIAINEKADSIAIAAATTVTSDAVGEVYVVVGDGTLILNGTANVPHLKTAYGLATITLDGWLMDGQDGLTIELTETGTDATHAVKWVINYIPLEDDASIVAA